MGGGGKGGGFSTLHSPLTPPFSIKKASLCKGPLFDKEQPHDHGPISWSSSMVSLMTWLDSMSYLALSCALLSSYSTFSPNLTV